ncbi:hypothetical protein [Luteibacter sp. SG786]|uniref:hypothetical protein n=1 Tax=Luteibacter sp. SG786 TaxID=2587130 RepID=UPI0014222B82|nr:hypothetical protein [Luteibacter sp. SG786]NII54370.1 hypothetical protein [Luteibacter sp. SG786]
MIRAHLITGHDHFKPAELPAPLEFDLGPGDAEFVAQFASAIDALRAKNAAESSKSKQEPTA